LPPWGSRFEPPPWVSTRGNPFSPPCPKVNHPPPFCARRWRAIPPVCQAPILGLFPLSLTPPTVSPLIHRFFIPLGPPRRPQAIFLCFSPPLCGCVFPFFPILFVPVNKLTVGNEGLSPLFQDVFVATEFSFGLSSQLLVWPWLGPTLHLPVGLSFPSR